MVKKLSLAIAISTAISFNSFAETTISPNAEPTCKVSNDELSNWFVSRRIRDNGFVTPADSTDIKFNPNSGPSTCDFYRWGAQMFLWLTSPVGQQFVFDGPVFDDVVHDGSGFVAIPNTGVFNNTFKIRALKNDPVDSTGQAGGGGVLLSQNKSLVYYGININDVFAGYRQGVLDNQFDDNSKLKNNFPTTEADLDAIQKANNTIYPDGQALAMEIKTSWVDVDTVQNADRFITIQADVPSYQRTGDTLWPVQTASVKKTLALVGMHVVGSVNGHPELIWATFEHVDNAPQKAYTYTNINGREIKVPFDNSGSWLFAPRNTRDETNVIERQSVAKSDAPSPAKAGDIMANSPLTIGPSPIIRLNPWGNLPNATTDKQIENATLLVSINSSVMRPLSQVSDVRANYFQVGSIWTSDGSIPLSTDNGDNDKLAGGHHLSNATMETYHQFGNGEDTNKKQNCFGCHGVADTDPVVGNGVSHIFDSLTIEQ
jgi:hypothetical protein